jgi:WD40 repeat protein
MVNYSVQTREFEEESPGLSVSGSGIGMNPFPGLRPFTIDECHLFFGRESQVDEILLKLSQFRAVTVMGYSGSEKSSLMYCGLVPVLYGGFMTQTGPHWQVVSIRPGNSPIENLTNSLVEVLFRQGRIDEKDKPIHHAIFNSVLRRSSDGLVEVSKFLQTREGENIFFLVDQFEELFRFKESGVDHAIDEASLYVNLILTAIHQKEVPVYVAINMRSDFIGDCSSFAGLTQMINDSNYLVPQMTREQKRMAIEGPVAVGSGKISPRLVKRLLSDIGDNQDQLPILQHALMRTWDYWVGNHDPGESMDIRHYSAIGKITQALSLHANEAYDELTTREKEIAEILFKNITEKNQENQEMRRPVRISKVCELADASEGEVIKVVEQFRQTGRSFLMPGIHVPLTINSNVELSHESLMRIWNRLSTWVDEEFESAHMYKRISDAAAMYQIGKTGLWRPPDLQLALNWQKKQKPTRTWAQRYDIAFERAVVFLDTSRITYEAELKNQEMLQRRMLRRARVTNIILAIFLVVAIAMFFYGLIQKIQAETNLASSEQNAKEALVQRDNALEQQKRAEDATILANKRQEEIVAKNDLLQKSNDDIKQALLRELELKKLAERNLQLATRERDTARMNLDKFRIEYQRAEAAVENFKNQLRLSIAQSLEAKSVSSIDDKDLAGLTAMQGYLWNTQYGGKKYDPYVFSGLYFALTKLSKLSYNAVKVPGELKNRMYALAVSNQGGTFYTTGNDGRIFKGDYLSQQISPNEVGANPFPNRVLALSKDDKYLVNGSDSSAIQIFNLANGSRQVIKAHSGFVTDIKFLPNNSGFISASVDRTLYFTNHVTGESKKLLTLPFDLKSIDINPSGTLLAGASVSGQLILVDLQKNTYSVLVDESRKPVAKADAGQPTAVSRILSVTFHPRRPLLAYGTEVLGEKGVATKGLVKIVNIETGKQVKELSGHKAGVSDIQFSPDGLLLASAGLDRKLQMWVVDKEEDLPIVMDNNNGNIWRVRFSKGSDYLLASCNNGEIRIWPTDPKMLAEQICPKLKRNMTPDEWEKYVGNGFPYESTCKSLLINDF